MFLQEERQAQVEKALLESARGGICFTWGAESKYVTGSGSSATEGLSYN